MKKLLLILLCLPMIGFGQNDLFDKIRVIKGEENVEDIFEGVGKSIDRLTAQKMCRMNVSKKILEAIADTSLLINSFSGIIPMEKLYPKHSFLKALPRKEKRKYKKLIENNLTINKDGYYTYKKYYIILPLDGY